MGDVHFSLNIFCRNSDIRHCHRGGVFQKNTATDQVAMTATVAP